jgi:hypothetical protein
LCIKKKSQPSGPGCYSFSKEFLHDTRSGFIPEKIKEIICKGDQVHHEKSPMKTGLLNKDLISNVPGVS